MNNKMKQINRMFYSKTKNSVRRVVLFNIFEISLMNGLIENDYRIPISAFEFNPL